MCFSRRCIRWTSPSWSLSLLDAIEETSRHGNDDTITSNLHVIDGELIFNTYHKWKPTCICLFADTNESLFSTGPIGIRRHLVFHQRISSEWRVPLLNLCVKIKSNQPLDCLADGPNAKLKLDNHSLAQKDHFCECHARWTSASAWRTPTDRFFSST